MVTVEISHAVYVRLDNRPGTLERAAKALGEHNINIDAVSLETNGPNGFARILTHKSREAVETLRKAGLDAYPTELAIASLKNKAGELARVSADLAAAGVNVEALVTTTDGRLAFRTSDVERTAEILRKH